ncbi:hypothetical protein N0V82_009292 [Gnomoniopsis sp. IMI 355080]|nr:hypothetical protein N0V82_009292 [Gnomoniopsis sp. IMI 355080]
MGNTPSKEPQGRSSHKLSKPRVTSFQAPVPPSGADLKRPGESVQEFLSIPYSATSSNNDDDHAGTGDNDQDKQGSDKSTPLVAPKAQRRLSLFRSKSSQEPPDSRKSRRNTIIGSPVAPSEGHVPQVTRANSVSTHHVTDQLQSGQHTSEKSRTSTNLSGSRFDDMPRRRASMYAQPQSAPISRSNSELSLHPPMRRRSLIQTPGVATRPSPGPTAARSTRSSLRHSHPPTPSMSRQPSTHFEESESDLLSFAPLAIPKAANCEVPGVATPKDSDYSITGAFKLGTLRITNGSPVLTPDPFRLLFNEVEETKSDGKLKDYFAQETPRESIVTSGGDVARPSEPTLEALDATDAETQKSKLDVAGEESTTSLSSPVPDLNLGGQPTSELQLSLDGTVQDHPPSPLMSQSKQAAVDDHLFEDETEISAPEVLDVRVDLSARSSTRQAVDSTETPEGVNRSDSGFVSNSKSESSQHHSSLAKADSGYSSNVSLRSLRPSKTSATRDEETGRSSTDSDQRSQIIHGNGSHRVLKIQLPSPVAVDDCTVDTPQSSKAPTPPPKDDYLLKRTSRNTSGAADTRADPTTPGRMRRKPLNQQPAAIDTSQTLETQELKSPKALPLSPASANSEGSSSSLSIANNSQKPGRLQRFLSLRSSSASKQTYTVHETHSVDSKVPSIPKEVEAKLREHTGLYPMTNKRLALKSQMSKETLKTILSVGSLEYANDDDLPPTPAFLDREDGEESNAAEPGEVNETFLKQTLASMQSNFMTTATSMLSSKKSLTRKPVPIREPEKALENRVGAGDSRPEVMGLTRHVSHHVTRIHTKSISVHDYKA